MSLQAIQTPEGNFLYKYTPGLVEADRIAAQVNAFKNMAVNLRDQEQHWEASAKPKDEGLPNVEVGKPLVNGNVASHVDNTQYGIQEVGGKKVLTLFGNAQGHKQLFSSSQKPTARSRPSHEDTNGSSILASTGTPMVLREDRLPNQIFSTQIVATDTQDALPTARQTLKFGELFKPPSSLQPLAPPKHSKRAVSRESNITWTRDSSSDLGGKSGYTNEKLPTGSWLGYNSISLTQEPVSPESKRKRRDRALSTGETIADPPEKVKAAQASVKEDALFRGVYSSFAPCKDDSEALIPEDVRSEVWWQRYGDACFRDVFALDPNSNDVETTTSGMAVDDDQPDNEAFREVVDNYDPMLLETNTAHDSNLENKDVQSILEEISELLESLQSFQRIRNATLRPNMNQTASAQVLASTPTPGETKLYATSKTRLANLVTRLPPYVVAKTDGEQLSDLIVSRQILMEGKNYQGVMEEDQASRRAAGEALSNALGATAAARPATGSRPSQPALARKSTGQGYNSTARPIPSSQRQPLSSWQTPAQSYASSAQRPGYSQQSNYSRPLTASYRAGATPQTNGPASTYPQSPSQPQYQQRAQNYGTAQGYGGYGSSHPYNRNVSQPTPQYQQPVQRPGSGYYNGGTGQPAVPQAPMQRAPMRPQVGQPAHSPLGIGSPYAPPNNSRPITPSTPAQSNVQCPNGGAGSSPSANVVGVQAVNEVS